jgi:hypothetical protein
MSQKLSEQEHQEILSIRKTVNEIASILGEIEYQRMNLDLLADEQKAKIVTIKRQEADFLEKIRSTYGNVSINLDTGDIT